LLRINVNNNCQEDLAMKRKVGILWLIGALVLSAAPVAADGDFYVVVAGGGVGTRITSLPYTIDKPGFYYLTGNLTYPNSENGITVNAWDVTIDLMGFCLSGSGDKGIVTTQPNVEVRNGTLSGWQTGFVSGGDNCRALNLRVRNCGRGIDLWTNGNLVKGCNIDCLAVGIRCKGIVAGNTISGHAQDSDYTTSGMIASGTISGNWLVNCTYGIQAFDSSSIIGNTLINPSAGSYAIAVSSNGASFLLEQNSVSGPGTHFIADAGTTVIKVNNAGF
jgi:hypothetical protein